MKDLSIRKLATAKTPEEALRKATSLLLKYSNNPEFIGLVEKLIKTVDLIEADFFAQAAKLQSPRGKALYIRALVVNCNAVEAIAKFRELKSDPHGQNALCTREFAKLLMNANCHEAAETVYWKAIEENPEDLQIFQESIENLLKLAEKTCPEKFTEARELAEFVYNHNPENPRAIFALAQVWYFASRMDKCLPYFREFFESHPEHAARAGFVFNQNYDENLSRESLREEHQSWCKVYMSLVTNKPVSLKRNLNPDRRLRIGYVSPDLGNHPVGFFAIPVLVNHDPEAVEVFIYSHRDPVAEHDAWSRRLQKVVGEKQWKWISNDSTRSLMAAIEKDQIDVLVDLAGHSNKNRLDAFANRAAPVQVTWLGYPHSTWLPNMDYRLSDSVVEPEEIADQWSSEAIYRMPNGFHALEMNRSIPNPAAPPCLKNGYLTFGSFNNINKIGSRTVKLWASLLRAVPDSRLLLKNKTMQVLENREGIRSLFAFEGIHPERISFKGVTREREQHFQTYDQVDIALDPCGYNGTTTTCEALYMGVPVLTLPGEKHASRVSASLLHRMGMDGWIARNEQHYVRIAQFAASNFDALNTRRMRMRDDFHNSPLADTVGLARELETAYRQFWRKHCSSKSLVTSAAHESTAKQYQP